MNLSSILQQLISQRRSIDEAIQALQKISNNGSSAGVLSISGAPKRRRRRLSAESKKKISEMMKKRWAERKRAAKAAS
ncbi:MAG: hypothetical protein JO041_01800 [Acidobacteria bacterium]|nr:hypothetical protein [Acidobacteriota bacterium]